MLAALLVVASPLLAGVSEISCPGIPGPLVAYGDNAEVVVAGKQGGFLEPMIATSVYGKGRIVAFGHGSFLSEAAMAKGQTKRLLQNAVRWVKTRGGIAAVHRATGIEGLLHEEGIVTKRLSEDDLGSLDGISLLVLDPNEQSPRHAEAIRKFVKDGGGLIVAGLGWGWLQLNPGKNIHQHPCNLIVEPMGIAWADGYLEHNSPAGYSATPGPPETNARLALAALKGGTPTVLCGQTLIRAAATLEGSRPLMKELNSLLASIKPTEQSPIKAQDVAQRLRMSIDLSDNSGRANAAAAVFPGQPSADTPTVSRTFKMDFAKKRWHSTGLFAVAGKPIRITVTQPAIDWQTWLRIGSHTDTIWHLGEWKRAPSVSTAVQINKQQMTVTSSFGGLIYIDVPHNAPAVSAQATIEGAVPAPRYILGKTTDEEWKTARNLPGPWAELESSKIILTVPSKLVRSLENPGAVMRFWDRVSDACADLAGIPRERNCPERYVPDVQISAGYMHSGYPIMTHLDAAPRMVDLNYLTDKKGGGDWGMFHEIGHNHQASDWTFDGTGEVTNNVFTLYIIETVVGTVPGTQVRFTDAELLDSFRKHRLAGAPFGKWKSDPFLALTMYVQLQRAFGWDAFKKVFAEYRTLAANERPKNDDEKRDQWMVRFSRTVGKNLGPFFDAWGVPVSAGAKQSISNLPVWNYPR